MSGDTSPSAADALRASALARILPALLLGGVAALVFARLAPLGGGYVARALALLAVGAALLFLGLPSHAPHARFGGANTITLARAVLVALVAALVGEVFVPQPFAFVLALLAALLDAFDGRLARRSGLASRYGARFDMETDALLIAALALLLWWTARVPAWVLLSGALRYLFIAATALLPRLQGTLAPSRRRQAIAVVQVTSLLFAFAPFVPVAAARTVAGAGLACLLYSFAVDTLALWRSGGAQRA